MVLVSEGTAGQVVQSGRARGIAAAISGWFALTWLAWGSGDPVPELLTRLLQVGSGLAALVAILGVVLAVRSPAESTPMRDPVIARRYGMVVGAEFALIAVGVVVLANTVGQEWIPVWICAGVGIHFIPMSRVFAEPSLIILGGLLTAVAAAALVVALTSDVAPATITSAGAGLALLVSGATTLVARSFYTGRS